MIMNTIATLTSTIMILITIMILLLLGLQHVFWLLLSSRETLCLRRNPLGFACDVRPELTPAREHLAASRLRV